jgi:hypothetical protein
MGQPIDPNQQAAEDAKNEALHVLATAKTFDELTDGVTKVYEQRRPRHGHEAAQILNFIEIRDPTKIVDVSTELLREALSRIARDNPTDTRPGEYLKLLG